MKRRTLLFNIFLVLLLGSVIGYIAYRQKTASENDILTPEERAWLTTHPVIRLAPDPNFPPIEFFNEQGVYGGMIADYFQLIEEKLHYRFEIVHLATWEDVIQQAKERKIDGITAAQITPERQEYLLFTQPIIDIPNVIIVRNEMPGEYRLEDMGGMTMTITSGNALQEYLQTQYPAILVRPVENDLQALVEVSFNRADATLVNLAIASYYIENQGISNLRVAGDSGKANPLAVATRSDEPLLNSILSKGLNALDKNQITQVSSKWVHLDTSAGWMNEGMKTGILAGLAVILLMLGVLALWNLTLRRLVVSKTRDLQEELVSRQQVEESLKRQNQFLDALNQTTLALTNRLDIDELLKTIIDQAMVLFNVPEAFIYSLDESGEQPELVVRAISEAYRSYLGFRVRKGEGLSGKVWLSGEPMVVADYSTWEGRADKFIDRTLHAMIAYPLKSGGKVIGVLGLSKSDPQGTFSDADIELIGRFASQAAIALDNAGLYITIKHELDERLRAERQLKQQNLVLDALNQTTLALVNRLDINELLQSIIDQAMVLFDVPEAFIYSLDESGAEPQLVVRAISEAYRFYLGFHIRVGEGLSGRVWQSGEPILVEDYAVWAERTDKLDRDRSLHAILGYPLKSGGRVIGVLGLSHTDPMRRFSDKDIGLVSRFASLVEIALDNANLYKTLTHELAVRQQAELRYRQLVEYINAITYLDANDEISSNLYTSPQIEQMMGYTVEEWLSDPERWVKLLYPDDRERVMALNEHCRTSGAAFNAEYRMYTRDGRVIWVHDDAVLIHLVDEDRKVWHGIMYDITERKQTEEALLQAEKRYRDLIERFHAVFYIESLSLESGFLYISPQVETMLGFTVGEWLANADLWLRIIHPEDREKVEALNMHVYQTGEDFRMEYRMIAKDGRLVWVYDESALTLDKVGNPENWQGVWIDITERKRSEEMLLASQKMADLGTLAAGVAHELNSPLQIITGASEVLLSRLDKNEILNADLLKHRLGMINQSAWRCAGIIRSLLNYARSTSEQMEYHNLNALVEEALNLIGHQLKTWSNIAVSTDLAPDLPDLWCDRNQILQVLINLMINARDAIPRGGGGVSIHTKYNPQSHMVILKVSDTGVGIPQDIIRNIFNPFFTTKPLGQGTGLGLSIVMGFVNAHNGAVEVESMPGQGTTFTLQFPEKMDEDANSKDLPPKAGRYTGEV